MSDLPPLPTLPPGRYRLQAKMTRRWAKAFHYLNGITKNKSCNLITAAYRNLYRHKLNHANCQHNYAVPQDACVVSFKRWHPPKLGLKANKTVRKSTLMHGCGKRLIC